MEKMPLLCWFLQLLIEPLPLSSSGHVRVVEIITSMTGDTNFLLFEGWGQIISCVVIGGSVLRLLARSESLWHWFVCALIAAGADIITIFVWWYQKTYTLQVAHTLWGVFWGFASTFVILMYVVARDMRERHGHRNHIHDRSDFRPMIVHAVALGISQSCALLLPGLSRFASTYATARFLKYQPLSALGISWMMQLPLMFASACVIGYAAGPHALYMAIADPLILMLSLCAGTISCLLFNEVVRRSMERAWLPFLIHVGAMAALVGAMVWRG